MDYVGKRALTLWSVNKIILRSRERQAARTEPSLPSSLREPPPIEPAIAQRSPPMRIAGATGGNRSRTMAPLPKPTAMPHFILRHAGNR